MAAARNRAAPTNTTSLESTRKRPRKMVAAATAARVRRAPARGMPVGGRSAPTARVRRRAVRGASQGLCVSAARLLAPRALLQARRQSGHFGSSARRSGGSASAPLVGSATSNFQLTPTSGLRKVSEGKVPLAGRI
jgi:hypothetical protein